MAFSWWFFASPFWHLKLLPIVFLYTTLRYVNYFSMVYNIIICIQMFFDDKSGAQQGHYMTHTHCNPTSMQWIHNVGGHVLCIRASSYIYFFTHSSPKYLLIAKKCLILKETSKTIDWDENLSLKIMIWEGLYFHKYYEFMVCSFETFFFLLIHTRDCCDLT